MMEVIDHVQVLLDHPAVDIGPIEDSQGHLIIGVSNLTFIFEDESVLLLHDPAVPSANPIVVVGDFIQIPVWVESSFQPMLDSFVEPCDAGGVVRIFDLGRPLDGVVLQGPNELRDGFVTGRDKAQPLVVLLGGVFVGDQTTVLKLLVHFGAELRI